MTETEGTTTVAMRSHHGSKPRSEWEWRTLDAIGARLAGIRLTSHITQYELTDYLGMPQSTYQNYERGNSEMGVLAVYRLCCLYSITPDELLGARKLKTPEVVYRRLFHTCGDVIGTKGTNTGSPTEVAESTLRADLSRFFVTHHRLVELRTGPGRRRQTPMASPATETFETRLLGTFATRLAVLRRSVGLSQADVARYLLIGTSTYQKYERGTAEIGVLAVCRLAALYGTSLSILLGIKPVTLAYGVLPVFAPLPEGEGDKPWSLPGGPLDPTDNTWLPSEVLEIDAHHASSYHHR